MAKAKALAAARDYPQAVVIGADTIVVSGRRFLGKPRDENEAKAMLRFLSGRRHHVVTGLAVLKPLKKLMLDSAVTAVWFRKLKADEIERYVASAEPLDKAGAYGIQGRAAVFVSRIDGDYFNVVGLPLTKLARLLERSGIRI